MAATFLRLTFNDTDFKSPRKHSSSTPLISLVPSPFPRSSSRTKTFITNPVLFLVLIRTSTVPKTRQGYNLSFARMQTTDGLLLVAIVTALRNLGEILRNCCPGFCNNRDFRHSRMPWRSSGILAGRISIHTSSFTTIFGEIFIDETEKANAFECLLPPSSRAAAIITIDFWSTHMMMAVLFSNDDGNYISEQQDELINEMKAMHAQTITHHQ